VAQFCFFFVYLSLIVNSTDLVENFLLHKKCVEVRKKCDKSMKLFSLKNMKPLSFNRLTLLLFTSAILLRYKTFKYPLKVHFLLNIVEKLQSVGKIDALVVKINMVYCRTTSYEKRTQITGSSFSLRVDIQDPNVKYVALCDPSKMCHMSSCMPNGSVGTNTDLKLKGLWLESRKRQRFILSNY
jgi:hypothetical protein